MLNTIATRADKMAFERPLALTLAGATAFAILARTGAGILSVALGLIAAAVAAIVADRAMRHPPTLRAPARAKPQKAEVIPAEQSDPVPEHRLVRLRRADRHPDAPARNPINAHAELGSPMMEIGAEPLPRRAPDTLFELSSADAVAVDAGPLRRSLDDDALELRAYVDPSAIEPDAPAYEVVQPAVLELAPAAGETLADAVDTETAEAEPVVADASADDAPVPEADAPAPRPVAEPVEPRSPVVAFAPVAAPAPVRVARPSLTEMMDRLSAGLDRRQAEGGDAPRPTPPALQDALRELNRLSARG